MRGKERERKAFRSAGVFFPLFLNLEQRKCLVVGAGKVAQRKVEALLQARGSTVVVGPRATRGIRDLALSGSVDYQRRAFEESDLEGVMLVIVATNDGPLNERVAREAQRLGIICNVVDMPDLCTAIFPSVVRRGMLQIAISTGGGSPALARWIKSQLETSFGEEYAMALGILSLVRRRVLKIGKRPAERRRIFRRLAGRRLVELCRRGEIQEIANFLGEVTGMRFSVETIRRTRSRRSSPRI